MSHPTIATMELHHPLSSANFKRVPYKGTLIVLVFGPVVQQ